LSKSVYYAVTALGVVSLESGFTSKQTQGKWFDRQKKVKGNEKTSHGAHKKEEIKKLPSYHLIIIIITVME